MRRLWDRFLAGETSALIFESDLQDRLHHQKTVFAIIVIFADTLNCHIAQPPVKVLGGSVADANLKHYSTDLTGPKCVLDMPEQTPRQAAAPVFGRDADGRQVGGIVFIDHDKCKRDDG